MIIWVMGLGNSNLYDTQKYSVCRICVWAYISSLYLLICLYTYMYMFVIILPSAICLCVHIYMDISLFLGIHIRMCSHNYVQLCLKSISKMQQKILYFSFFIIYKNEHKIKRKERVKILSSSISLSFGWLILYLPFFNLI